MKASELIINLQKLIEEHGDLDVIYAKDDEGNGYSEVYYNPSVGMYSCNEFDTTSEEQNNAFCIN